MGSGLENSVLGRHLGRSDKRLRRAVHAASPLAGVDFLGVCKALIQVGLGADTVN